MCLPFQHTILIEDRTRSKIPDLFRFIDNNFQFSESIHLLYQLMWHIPCSSSVSIDNPTDLNPVSEVAIQLERHILSIFLKNNWLNGLTLTRKWAEAPLCMTTFVVIIFVAKKYLPKVRINYFREN